MTTTPLRLIAFDTDDLHILSAHTQDAILNSASIQFNKKNRTVSFLVHRFNWQNQLDDESPSRFNCVLEIRHAIALRTRGFPADKHEEHPPLNLLAITFESLSTPAGYLILHFSGNAALQVHVECLEATLADIGEAWQTTCCPNHNSSEEN